MDKLEIRNLTKVFGRSPKRALKLLDEGKGKEEILKETGCTVGVNRATFDIHNGEIFVIMGLSGSGKSTVVRLLNRLIEPTDGSILLDNKDIMKMSVENVREIRRKKMGMVFQKFALFPHRTVLENVEFGLEIQGVAKVERQKRAMDSLELVGLGNYADQNPDQLSGGMQQRVGLARALANDPDILLMDEAFSALDPLIRKEMQDELVDLQQRMKKTIIFITHDLDEAIHIGDRIMLMRDGTIQQIGTPEEILTNPANDYVKRFVKNVDLTHVITAEVIMKPAESIMMGKDGPRVALKKMKEKALPTIVVTDRNRMVKGIVTAEGLKEALEKNLSLEDILVADCVTVSKETPINDLLVLMAESEFLYPSIVTNEEGKLKGVIGRGALFSAFAGYGGEKE
ncbi:glycine betaine/L-proline ABC transporter ATP-binding protein [Thermoactinomyces sp. DSM 45892]|uniref:quaternary amine ABC transporter ATP-binding protein n=1 Tax=Thermoactinomyces sp. DSM 45892 TaxID=1882753 RepID=UPI000895FDE3|nr:glycine betaine/L-proline ABC transporter ATP-binding protein [Thermoactinomyces sp. DSM 45892]SDZ32655.1 glycine betaine/proline transport system ATP-binding protein [Thermoactinomyces sp. DSM 45892]